MIPLEDSAQPHIWFETCESCQGSFFDAGEISDLASHTWLDYIRDWTTPKRNRGNTA